MAEYSQAWKVCINKLLEAEGLTVADAAVKSGAASAAYWGDWRRDGRVPDYKMAVRALEPFINTSHDIVFSAMSAAGFPIPPEWLSDDPAEIVLDALHLRGKEIPEEGQQQIRDLIREIMDKTADAGKGSGD